MAESLRRVPVGQHADPDQDPRPVLHPGPTRSCRRSSRELLADPADAAAAHRGLDDTGELNLSRRPARRRQLPLSSFKQRGSVAGVIRYIPREIPTLESLACRILLPIWCWKARPDPDGGRHRHRQEHHAGGDARAGATSRWPGHILTIEDPIEFLFTNKKSVVNQREVGRDTQSLQVALKNALRQAPDCILIGEIRDRETMAACPMRCRATWCCHDARQQQLPRAGPDHRCRSTRPRRAPLLGDLAGCAPSCRSASARHRRRARAGGRGAAQHQGWSPTDREGRFAGIKEAMESPGKARRPSRRRHCA